MPRVGGVAKIVLEGHLADGEIFRTGFWLLPTTPPDLLAQWIAQVGLLIAPINSLVQALTPYIDDTSGYDTFTAYYYQEAGPSPATLVTQQPITNGQGVGGSAPLPLQCSVVASLRTDYSGRSARGRMFLPLNSAALDATHHQLIPAVVDSLAQAVAAGITAINGQQQTVIISSAVQSATYGVTKVLVDSRVDIQRRRAESQAPFYSKTQGV